MGKSEGYRKQPSTIAKICGSVIVLQRSTNKVSFTRFAQMIFITRNLVITNDVIRNNYIISTVIRNRSCNINSNS